MSLAQGIQIEFLENGIIDNYAACTVSHKKDQISRTQDCTTIKLGETFLQPYKYLVYGNKQPGGNGQNNN